MTRRTAVLSALALFLPIGDTRLNAGSFQIRVDLSDAPNAQPYAKPVEALFKEWYPKINEILFGKTTPLPFKEVRVVFEKISEVDTATGRTEVPAYTKANVVHVNARQMGRVDNAYLAMLIHELTHICQNYQGLSRSPAKWVGEGVADYVRHKYFEKDLKPMLEWDSDGTLKNSDLDRATLAKQGYQIGYTIAAPFLYWLELHRNRQIVTILSRDVRESRYSADVFETQCGAPLDSLWKEFLAQ
jgi:hypothetical protein